LGGFPAAGAGDGVGGRGGGFGDHVIDVFGGADSAGPTPEFVEGRDHESIPGGAVFDDELALERGARSPRDEHPASAAARAVFIDAASDDDFVGGAGGLTLADFAEERAEVVFKAALETVGEDLAGVAFLHCAAGEFKRLNHGAIVTGKIYAARFESERLGFDGVGCGAAGRDEGNESNPGKYDPCIHGVV